MNDRIDSIILKCPTCGKAVNFTIQ
jgi:endogenous inhibitor of DNA gyrase (YacG/DUF329 family)